MRGRERYVMAGEGEDNCINVAWPSDSLTWHVKEMWHDRYAEVKNNKKNQLNGGKKLFPQSLSLLLNSFFREKKKKRPNKPS